MTQEPVVIKAEDIIKRPAEVLNKTLATGKTGQASIVNEVKGFMKQAKEIIELAKEMGLPVERLKALLPGLNMGAAREDAPAPQGGMNQIKLIQRFLIASYGDITIAELADKLKKDYGAKKLSDMNFGS